MTLDPISELVAQGRKLGRQQQSGGMPEDEGLLSAASVQMSEEILELNRALKFAYGQLAAGGDEEILRLRAQVAQITAVLDALHQSASWRVTGPLRRLCMSC
ncbi:hypothetical protein GCM10027082_26690 [Comamonas humi]